MENLTIKIPEGFVVEDFNKTTGEIRFKEKPKTVFERIKTIDDVYTDQKIDVSVFENSLNELSEDEIAYKLLKLICKSLNEGWTPNWNDSNEKKYIPWFKMGSSGFRYDAYAYWRTVSAVGSRLCFRSEELAKYAGTQFQDIYERYMLIKNK